MKRLKLIIVTLLTDNNNDLIVFSLNIRSIRKYFNELLLVINSAYIKFYIVMFYKAWLDNDIIGNFAIKGYNIVLITIVH